MKIKVTESNQNIYNVVEACLNKFPYPDYASLDSDVVFHNTRISNVFGILNNGLLVDHTRNNDGSIWCSLKPHKEGYGACTVALISNESEIVSDSECIIHHDVPTSDILFIDVVAYYSDSGTYYRLSDIPNLIKRFGEDKVINVLNKPQMKSLYPIEDLIQKYL